MTLIDSVRAATYSNHQALDNLLIPYIQNIQHKIDYAALLLQFYGFFKPVYDSIDACIDVSCLPDYPNRRKPDWILRDLEDLSVDYNLQICRHTPLITNNASAFGALYVLEGSTLGGTVIKKMVSEQLGTDKGLSFFSGYGRQTRERWNVFIQSLNNISNDNRTDEIVIKTAKATFTFFKEWLQPVNLPTEKAGML